ncbi:MAG: HPr kinase/phosphorylase [Clostridiales bacterium]|nr:HPr kinase/phosphorylase [Clostridiales bacterium]
MSSIPFKNIIKAFDLENIYCAENVLSMEIDTSDINRPGLQFAGFFDYFDYHRIQVIGKSEMEYLKQQQPDAREKNLNEYFKHDIPCAIISRDMQIPEYIMHYAKKYKRPILRSRLSTTTLIDRLVGYLDSQLAPKITKHGVLLDIYGVGMFLMGESGIGKSETALELIKRGHRLVADDAVEIKKVAEHRLIGESPELIKHFMELRGIGIIDIKAMYGVGAVINNKPLDLAIQLEFWDSNKEYDRLGLVDEYTEILGAKVPKIVVPVRPGRNLAIIVEVAARNWRLKKLGYNAAQVIDDRLKALIQTNENNNGGG